MNRHLTAVVLMTVACAPSTLDGGAEFGERFRPRFHFTPPSAWMNDPNGMVYYDGEYHLFYQHYPDGTVWGPMHWGHAVSTDMVHWEHLPIALFPDSLGYIFSGSAVVDWNNTSGFQTGDEPPLIAMFSQHDPIGEQAGAIDFQTQGVAYSNDRGRSWTVYPGNPVIPNPGIRDFRDPKVRWHETSGQWVMVLAAGDRILFYGSPDLKSWTTLSEFGVGEGSHGGVWECPDLFPLTAPDGSTRWVLLVSIGSGAANGGSGTQYFVGDFDGVRFTNDNPPDQTLWLDYGRDNYAGVTWSDVPNDDGRQLFIGWNSNWAYAQVVPTEGWRSAMTLPRALQLADDGAGLRVASVPVQELGSLRGQPVDAANGATIESGAFEVSIDMRPAGATRGGVMLRSAAGDEYRFGFDRESGVWFSDRRRAGMTTFSESFAEAIHTAPLLDVNAEWNVRVFVDHSSVEAFVNQGRVVMSELVFPEAPFDQWCGFRKGEICALRTPSHIP